MNQELPDVQAGFRKGRGTRDQIANICWIIEKAREFQKKTAASLIMPKSLIVWITTNCGKFLKRWEYQTTLPASWQTCMQVKKQQLEPDMEQQTGSKLGKEYIKAVYCHLAYLTYMLGWLSTSWNQKIVGRNVNNLRYADDTTLMAESKSESEVTQSCPTLCDSVDCSLPASSVHGILQVRMLEWVAISFPKGSSRSRDRTWVDRTCLAGRHFNPWATRQALTTYWWVWKRSVKKLV